MKVWTLIALALALLPLAFADAGADSIAAAMVDTSNGNYYALVMSTLGVGVPNGLIGTGTTATAAGGGSTGNTVSISSCSISPASATMNHFSTRTFTVTCWGSPGGIGGGQFSVPCTNLGWSGVQTTLVSTSGQSALFNATGYGTGSVNASVSYISGIGGITVFVRCGAPVTIPMTRGTEQQTNPVGTGTSVPAKVAVTPSSITLASGATQQFKAAVYDQYGQIMTGAYKVAWSTSVVSSTPTPVPAATTANALVPSPTPLPVPLKACDIDQNGLFSALIAGVTCKVTATVTATSPTPVPVATADGLISTGTTKATSAAIQGYAIVTIASATPTTAKTTTKTAGGLTTTATSNPIGKGICKCGKITVSCTAESQKQCAEKLAACQTTYAWSGDAAASVGAASSVGGATGTTPEVGKTPEVGVATTTTSEVGAAPSAGEAPPGITGATGSK